MRRFAVVAAFAMISVGSAAALSGHHALAQEATPAAPVSMLGITYALQGYIPGAAMPEAVDMEVARGTLEPDAGFPFSADDPAAVLMIMESGEITATVENASWTISRGAAVASILAGTPAANGASEVLEVIDAGEPATFFAGDVAYIPGNSTGELHNSGDELVVTQLITYLPSGS